MLTHDRTRYRWRFYIVIFVVIFAAGLLIGCALTLALIPTVPGREVHAYIKIGDMTLGLLDIKT